jgi:hypothetical protein
MARFSNAQVAEAVQPFWAALQAGEFITDAAVQAGTYRKQGTRWVAACGGVRPRRGRNLRGRCLSFAEPEEIALSRARAGAARSATCARGPTRPGPTARLSATSRPCSANGPTRWSTPPARRVGPHCHTGCATTTSGAPTAPSATALPSTAFGRSLGSTSRAGRAARPRGSRAERLDRRVYSAWPNAAISFCSCSESSRGLSPRASFSLCT